MKGLVNDGSGGVVDELSVRVEGYRTAYPKLDRLFTLLGQGIAPNFLDVMAAINEMVGFYTVCDTVLDDIGDYLCKMSGKKCRNCC